MDLSGYACFQRILCGYKEQEWMVYKYLSRGAVCDYLYIP